MQMFQKCGRFMEGEKGFGTYSKHMKYKHKKYTHHVSYHVILNICPSKFVMMESLIELKCFYYHLEIQEIISFPKTGKKVVEFSFAVDSARICLDWK